MIKHSVSGVLLADGGLCQDPRVVQVGRRRFEGFDLIANERLCVRSQQLPRDRTGIQACCA